MNPPDSQPPPEDPRPTPELSALGAEHLGPAAEAASDDLGPLRERLGALLEGYRLGKCLGRGGMGAVFLAHQERLDRQVAIKVLIPPETGDAAWTERFQREARALARLAHAGIVAVHDFGQAEDLAWIVMEYVEGVSLRSLLSGDRLSPEEALAIVPQICNALQFAHDKGVVHRDIKPENILLDLDGHVKIADFGLAKLIDGDVASGLTGTDQAMGTLRYMAPEQLERPKSVDHRADIFALGVVFYEMLTGQVPAGRVEPPSSHVRLDVRLDEIVLRALEREPEKRYQTAREVQRQLAEIESQPDASGVGGAPPPPASSASVPAGPSSAPLSGALAAAQGALPWVDRAVALVSLSALVIPGAIARRTPADELDPAAPGAGPLLLEDPLALLLLGLLALPLAAQAVRGLRERPLRAGALRLLAGLLALSVFSVWFQLRTANDASPRLTDTGMVCGSTLLLASLILGLAASTSLLPALGPALARRRPVLGPELRARLRWVATALCVAGLVSLTLSWSGVMLQQLGWESPFGLIAGVSFGIGLLVRWGLPLSSAPWLVGGATLLAGAAAFTTALADLVQVSAAPLAPPGPVIAFCIALALALLGLVELATRNESPPAR